jgi:hypothetical protein
MGFKLGHLDKSKQWCHLCSTHRVAFRCKVPSVWPRDIAFSAFIGKAQDEGFNIDLPSIEGNVIKYVDST